MTRTTLSNFVRAVGPWAADQDLTEKVVLFSWGPVMLILPGERRAWKAST